MKLQNKKITFFHNGEQVEYTISGQVGKEMAIHCEHTEFKAKFLRPTVAIDPFPGFLDNYLIDVAEAHYDFIKNLKESFLQRHKELLNKFYKI